MSTGSSLNSVSPRSFEPAPIYGPTDVVILISRGWNLVKVNLKASLSLMLIPSVIFALNSVLAAIPASMPAATSATPTQLFTSLAVFMTSIALSLSGGLVFILLCSVLIRIYHATIVRGEPMPVREALQGLKRTWPGLLLLYIVNIALYLAFIVMDAVVFAGGGFFAVFLIGLTSTQSAQVVKIGGVITALGIGCITLVLFASLISIQSMMLTFPLIAMSISNGQQMSKAAISAVRLLFGNIPRTILFGFLIFLLVVVLSLSCGSPVYIWGALETQRMGSELPPGVFPLHVQIVANLWSNLVNIFLVPLMLGAATLFWYDCKVRREGLDLRLRFNRLVNGRPSAAFKP
jgi:hypothetical protein